MNCVFRNLLTFTLAALAGGFAAAQDGGVPAEHHPWGRFPKGSWKLTRVIAENLDPLGNVISTNI